MNGGNRLAVLLLILTGLLSACAVSRPGQRQPPPMHGKVLVVLSSSDHFTLRNGRQHRTGLYLNELAVPLQRILAAGYEVVFANPKGNQPAIDERSDAASYFGNDPRRLLQAHAMLDLQPTFKSPRNFEAVLTEGLESYDGIFIPGGHAPMEDLWENAELGRILRAFHDRQKPTAAICHGPIALLSTGVAVPSWPYKGYGMTVFSTAEEKIAEKNALGGRVRFYPDAELKKAGAIVETGPAFKSKVVSDRELITGQNPSSDEALATAFVTALDKRGSRK